MRYFEPYELVDRKTFEERGERCLCLFTPQILDALVGVREFFDRPVIVNNWHSGGRFQWRGYRTPEKAKELGSEYSSHAFVKRDGFYIPLCNAIDFDVEGMTANEVRQCIILNKDNPLLQNITRMEERVNWVHIDAKELTKYQKRIYLFHA